MKKNESQEFIRSYIAANLQTSLGVLELLAKDIEKAAAQISKAIAEGGQWLVFGNGGSAADAQHLAAEMVGRLDKMERRGLKAIALNTDTSALTAIANDYGFEEVFSKQVAALAAKGDVVMGLSTSGNSPNVMKAFATAHKLGCKTIGLSGKGGGRMKKACQLCLTVPSNKTAHVQEAHGMIGHMLCFLVEQDLKKRGKIKKAL